MANNFWEADPIAEKSSASNFWDADPVVAMEPKKESGFVERAGDYGLTAIKGAIDVPEAVVGLADMVTGGYVGKALEHLGFRPEEAKAFLDEHYSDAQKLANANLNDAQGFLGKAAAAVKNPSTIAHAVVESLPVMGAGGLIGRGLVQGAKVAPWAAGAVGEGVVGGGLAAEQIRQQTDDGTMSVGQSGAALASGAGTAAFGALGGKLASKFKWADIDTVIAQGGPDALAADAVKKGFMRRVAESGISEGVFEEMPQSMQEQVWQNAALDKPLMQGVPESGAMGLITGGVMGGVGGGFFGAKPQDIAAKPQPKTPTPTDILAAPDVDTAIQNFTDSLDGADLLDESNTQTPQREFGTLSQGTTGFGQVNELADLVAQEQTDLEQRRGGLIDAQQQDNALRMESGIESTDARVAGTQAEETRTARLQLLDDVYANPKERSPGMTFLAQLEASFPHNPNPTAEEKQIIAKRESAHQAFGATEPPPAEVTQEQAKPNAPRTQEAQIAQVEEYLAKGYTPISGGRMLANEKGKKLLLTVTQREYVKIRPTQEAQNGTILSGTPENAQPDLRPTVPVDVEVRDTAGTGGGAMPDVGRVDLVDNQLATGSTQRDGDAAGADAQLPVGAGGAAVASPLASPLAIPAQANANAISVENRNVNTSNEIKFGENIPPSLPVSTSATTLPSMATSTPPTTSQARTIKMLSDGRHAAIGFTPEQLRAADQKVFIDGKGNGIYSAKSNKIQLEHALGISTIPEGSILADGDNPYKNQMLALIARKNKKLDKTHIAKKLDGGGFALVPKAEPKKKQAKRTDTLLTAIRDFGDKSGLKLSTKSDVVRDRFAPGGYNQLFRAEGRYSIEGMAGKGELDDYLPFEMRFSTKDNPNGEDADMSDAVEWIKEQIASGTKVLPYEVQQELDQKAQEAEYDGDVVADISEEFNYDELNAKLQLIADEEREAEQATRIFDAIDEESGIEGGTGVKAREGRQEAERPNLNLTGQTNAEVLDAEARREQAGREEEAQIRAQAAERGAIDQADIDARTTARVSNSDNFQFGENSKQAAAPVADLFNQPAKPAPEAAAQPAAKAKPEESAINAALRSVGIDPNAPPDKAKALRREAEKLMKESRKMLDGIPAGQPIHSTRDRNLRDKSMEKARKAGELYAKAEELEKAKVETNQTQEQQATAILDRANVTGKDRLDIMRDFKDGKHSLEDLEAAYPAKVAEDEVLTGSDFTDAEYRALIEKAEKENSLVPESMRRAAFIKGVNDGVYGNPKQRTNADAYSEGYAWGAENRKPSQPAQADQPAEAKPQGKIEDFGEHIPGSRKDKAAAMREAVSRELSDDDIASMPLSKIWPKDSIDQIEDIFIAAVAHTARAEVPAKPKVGYKLKAWVEKVKMVRSLASMMLDGTVTKERFTEQMKVRGLRGLEHFASKVALLEQIDRARWDRIGRVEEYPNAYRYDENSKQIPSPIVHVVIDGRMQTFRGAKSVADALDQIQEKLGGEVAAKKMEFDVRGREGAYFINKKGDPLYRKLKTFETSKEALDYRKINYDDLVAAWEAVKESDNVKEEDVRGKENRPRSAEDWRKGKDVTPEQFASTFGFKGVQFGEWVSQGKNIKERQGMLNEAYDAFMDLADIIGVPPKALALDGSLGLGFGARGSGKFAAHFEPDMLVINLTKTRGAGTLAHEWFHAMDNYFQRERIANGEKSQRLEGGHSGDFITYAPENYYVNKRTGQRMPARDFALAQPGHVGDITGTEQERKVAKMRRMVGDPAQWELKEGVRPEVGEAFADLVKALNESPMAKRASLIDKGRSGGYWSRTIERGARSFENYVIHKMMLEGYHNDYLANVIPVEQFQRDEGRYPYLLEGEIQPVAEAFDNLFATIQTKETDNGVAMFSQSATPARNPFTLSTLTAAIDNAMGKGFAGLLEATGKFKLIESAEIGKYLGEGAAFSKAQDQTPRFILSQAKMLERGADGNLSRAFERYIPLDSLDGLEPVPSNNESDDGEYHAGVPITQPIEVKFDGELNVFMVYSGNHRIAQARANGQTHIIAFVEPDERFGRDYIGGLPKRDNPDLTNPDIRYSKDGRILAFVTGGNTYLVADNISGTDDNVKGLLTHEIGLHALQLGRNDAEFQSILKQIETMRKMGNKQVVAAFNRVPADTPAHLITEEATGYMLENSPELSVSQKVIAWFRAQLRKIGKALPVMQRMQWFRWADKLQPNDIVYMARQALQSAPQTLTQAQDRGTFKVDRGEPLFSKAQQPIPGTAQPPVQPPQRNALPAETKTETARRVGQDAMLRFRVIQDWLKDQGVKLSEAADVYVRENLSKATTANRIEDFRNFEIGPLIQNIAKAGFDLNEITDYLQALHIPEANTRMRNIHNDRNATANGITDTEAKAALAEFKAMPKFAEFKALADEVHRIGEQTLEMRYAEGLVSKEQYDAYKSTYQHWIPLRGDMPKQQGFGRGMSTNAKQKRRFGHDQREEFIFENLVSDRERAIFQIEHNKLGRAVANFILEANNPDIGTISKPERQSVLKDSSYAVAYNGQILSAFNTKQDAQNYILKTVSSKSGVIQGLALNAGDFDIQKTNDPHVAMMVKPMLAENEIQVYINGHAVRLQLNDPLLARAATNSGIEQLAGILYVARQINGFLSKAYTAWSPDFLFVNPVRDLYQGSVVLTGKEGIGFAGQAMKNYAWAWKELWDSHNDTRKSGWVTRYRKAGGNTGGAYLSDIERVGQETAAALQEFMGWKNTFDSVQEAALKDGKSPGVARTKAALKAGIAGGKKIPALGHFLRLMERLNGVFENTLRLATFKAAIDSGKTDQQAAMLAKDLMNFNRKGEIANQMGAAYLFFNPAIQGSHVVMQSMISQPHSAQARWLVGGLMMSAFLLAEAGRAGDDDDERDWRNIPDYVKARNLVLKFGDMQVTIPVAYGFGVFHSLGNAMSDLLHGVDSEKVSLEMATSIFENFSVFGNPLIEQDGKVEFHPEQLLPTVPKMVTAPATNLDSLGRTIQPRKFKASTPDSQNMTRSARGTLYADVAASLNDWTGGSEYQSGLIDVSPNTLKYWVSSLTGGAGRFMGDTYNAATGGMRGVAPELANIPIARKFVRESDVADSRAAFWQTASKARLAAEAYRSALKDGDRIAAAEMKNENLPYIQLAKMAAHMGELAGAKRNQIEKINASDIPLAEKKEKIKELENREQEIYDRFLDAFDRKSQK